MRLFFKKILINLLLPFILVFAGGMYLEKKLAQKTRVSGVSSEYVEWNAIFDGKINADLVVLGSSRAWVHIDPKKIDSAFQLNSYNLGMAAYSFDGQYARFQSYVKANKFPKIILHCIDYNTLSKTKSLFRTNQFLPYYSHNDISGFLKSTGQLSFLDHHLPVFKYRWISNQSSCLMNSGLYICGNVVNATATPDNGKYKGFQAQNSHWNDEINVQVRNNTQSAVEYSIDESSLKEFMAYIDACKQNGSKLVFVYPPEFAEIKNKVRDYDRMVGYYKDLAQKNNLPFLDYRGTAICSDTAYFYDYRHLNAKGVDTWNAMLIKDLKEYLGRQ